MKRKSNGARENCELGSPWTLDQQTTFKTSASSRQNRGAECSQHNESSSSESDPHSYFMVNTRRVLPHNRYCGHDVLAVKGTVKIGVKMGATLNSE